MGVLILVQKLMGAKEVFWMKIWKPNYFWFIKEDFMKFLAKYLNEVKSIFQKPIGCAYLSRETYVCKRSFLNEDLKI